MGFSDKIRKEYDGDAHPVIHPNYDKTRNSHGYRAPEFHDIDWPESIVLIGCSFVFGTGLEFEDTIGCVLQELTGRPVINLGVPGSSIHMSVYNQTILRENNIEPWAVVNIWTSLYRFYFQNSDLPTGAINLAHWLVDHPTKQIEQRADIMDYVAQSLMFQENLEANACWHIRMARQIWRDTAVRYHEFTFFEHVKEHNPDIRLLRFYDHVTDGWHPGPISARKTAEIIQYSL
jgi:hypothetical protein